MAEDCTMQMDDADACVEEVIRRVGNKIILGLPLGLGKPLRFVNALYQRAKRDPQIELHIFTALSLVKPSGRSALEKRFLEPFAERLYGAIPDLEYALDLRANKLPPNVKVSEFFFKAGSFMHNSSQQRHYISLNYTHAVRDLMAKGINVVAQMVAPGDQNGEPGQVSLSCNPDLTLDIIPLLRARQREEGVPTVLVGELNRHLPWLGRDAQMAEADIDVVLAQPQSDYPMFPAPQMAISPPDHLIGFYASTLIKDGGTLQVGIGSLGTALINSTILRHRHNDAWKRLYQHLDIAARYPAVDGIGGTGTFDQGLYGCSEMIIDGFIHLVEAGVLKREVFAHQGLQELLNRSDISVQINLDTLDVLLREHIIASPLRPQDLDFLQKFGIVHSELCLQDGKLSLQQRTVPADINHPDTRRLLQDGGLGDKLSDGVVMHGGFYIGPESFYQALRDLSPPQRQRICMTSVNYINDLYDHRFGNQALKAAQRQHGRFINTAMMYTLAGAAVSDGLEDGRVVSGVGGQYNFVAMGMELTGARSILCLRSTRKAAGKVLSNIVFSYGHCTIPRHLRDIVITEYGIADLRGQSDEQVYLRLIAIADARFQAGLLQQAKKAGKVAKSFKPPKAWADNTPAHIHKALAAVPGNNRFPPFPFGCDFTAEELVIAKALKRIQAETATGRGKLMTLVRAARTRDDQSRFQSLLERMQLAAPKGVRQKLEQRLLIYGLRLTNTPQ